MAMLMHTGIRLDQSERDVPSGLYEAQKDPEESISAPKSWIVEYRAWGRSAVAGERRFPR